MDSPKVIVTGAGGPAGVNFINSLNGTYFKTVGVDMNKYRIHLCPSEERYVVPPTTHMDYFSSIYKIAKETGATFLHPQPDIDVKWIGASRACLEEHGIKTFLPSTETIEIMQDKHFTSAKLVDLKIVPRTRVVVARHEYYMIDDAIRDIEFPMWVRATHGAGGHASSLIKDSKQLYAWLDYWIQRGVEKMIAQEVLPGRNYAWHSIWKDGQLITSMARERIEYIYPGLAPSGITGTPAVQRTIHNDKVNKIATGAVLAIDPKYSGIACVDLKEDKYGIPNVCEINPGRMFTTSNFFTQLGNLVLHKIFGNYPYLYLTLGMGKSPMPGNLPKYNSLPKGWYWIRHIDCGYALIHEDDLDEKICDSFKPTSSE